LDTPLGELIEYVQRFAQRESNACGLFDVKIKKIEFIIEETGQ
jgi:hypothetical protein